MGRLRPITSPAAPVTALLRSDCGGSDQSGHHPAGAVRFSLQPLPPAAGVALSADGDVDTVLAPGEVRILRAIGTQEIPGGAIELTRSWAESNRIAVEAVEPGGEFPAKTIVRPGLHSQRRHFWRWS